MAAFLVFFQTIFAATASAQAQRGPAITQSTKNELRVLTDLREEFRKVAKRPPPACIASKNRAALARGLELVLEPDAHPLDSIVMRASNETDLLFRAFSAIDARFVRLKKDDDFILAGYTGPRKTNSPTSKQNNATQGKPQDGKIVTDDEEALREHDDGRPFNDSERRFIFEKLKSRVPCIEYSGLASDFEDALPPKKKDHENPQFLCCRTGIGLGRKVISSYFQEAERSCAQSANSPAAYAIQTSFYDSYTLGKKTAEEYCAALSENISNTNTKANKATLACAPLLAEDLISVFGEPNGDSSNQSQITLDNYDKWKNLLLNEDPRNFPEDNGIVTITSGAQISRPSNPLSSMTFKKLLYRQNVASDLRRAAGQCATNPIHLDTSTNSIESVPFMVDAGWSGPSRACQTTHLSRTTNAITDIDSKSVNGDSPRTPKSPSKGVAGEAKP